MSKKETLWDIAVIGGGASGMMAAITAARTGKTVVLVEHKDQLGKKILATGNGKCNFTNSEMTPEAFRGDQNLFHSIYKQFDRDDTLSFFHEIGVLPKCRKGYYYPASEQALSIQKALEMELTNLGVTIMTGCVPDRIQKADSLKSYLISGAELDIPAKKIIIATGLLASPNSGSDGSFIPVIKNLGHHFTPVVPALCGFETSGYNPKSAAGVRFEGTVSLFIDHVPVASDRGEIQFTEYGISGIPVFQISRYASVALYEKKQVEAVIDLFPSLSIEELALELKNRFYRPSRYRRNYMQIFNGLLNQKLTACLCEYCGFIPEQKPKEEQYPDAIRVLKDAIKGFRITLTKPRSFEYAQIACGGVRSEEINPESLESRLWPGIYFCGELLDVDGICGGYNLQWAWSSGYAAGLHASRQIEEEKS